MDCTKAFDLVQHSLLFDKMMKAGCPLKAWRESIPTYSYRNRPNFWYRPMYLGVDVQNLSYKQCNAISLD